MEVRQILKLQAAIKFEMDDMTSCKMLIEQLPKEDADLLANEACVLFKDGSYPAALSKYTEASKVLGFQAELAYCMALSHYMLKDFIPALKLVTEILERAIKCHPGRIISLFAKVKASRTDVGSDRGFAEWNIGFSYGEDEARSVGNTQSLHETFVFEAFNLKAAIEFHMKNCKRWSHQGPSVTCSHYPH
jgi:tetratricopeptide repeat protein 30